MKRKYHLHLKGRVGGYDFNADYVDFVLAKHEAEQVNVIINSLGGSVATALSVSAAFKRHGNVHVHYEAMNASAATIASLGAKRVTMDRAAMYLVHQCSQEFFLWDGLNADQLEDLIANLNKAKDDLNKIDANIAAGYAARCKKDKQDLLALMKAGGWLTADEALAWGFVDEVTDLPEDEQPQLTAEVRDYMASEGIPVPDLPMASEQESERGLIAQFKAFLRGLYQTSETTNQVLSEMKKTTYVNVCKILKCEGLEADQSGKVVMAEEQVTLLEDALAADGDTIAALRADVAERDTAIAALNEQVAALQEQVASLNDKPAADSQQVVTAAAAAAEPSPMEAYCQEVSEAQNMLNQLKK